MRMIRGFAAAAIPAAFAVWLAGPATAAPTLTGHFIRMEKTSSGVSTRDDWFFSSCGSGCATEEGGSLARFSDGQWEMDIVNGLHCADGSKVNSAVNIHYAWDATTLHGTGQAHQLRPACGNPGGGSWTVTIQLEQAP